MIVNRLLVLVNLILSQEGRAQEDIGEAQPVWQCGAQRGCSRKHEKDVVLSKAAKEDPANKDFEEASDDKGEDRRSQKPIQPRQKERGEVRQC